MSPGSSPANTGTGASRAPTMSGREGRARDLHGVSRLTEELSADYLEEQGLLPVSSEDGRILVACSEPPDPQAVAELEALFDAPVELLGAPEAEITSAIRDTYGREASSAEQLVSELEADDEDGRAESLGAHDVEGGSHQAPAVRLVNMLLSEAVEAGVSDIHLEATDGGMRARYRIDGVLQEAPSPPAYLREAMVSRLKVMAELDIAERRSPQDGRIRLRVEDRALDVRVSTLPTLHGESVVLRLLDAERQRHQLDGLGMAGETYRKVVEFASRPQGVLLSTGPTGSGKTTTLYAVLQHVRSGHEKIVSVEDPVEYELEGVAQVPVQEREGGLGFAGALRSILRQDPDVLLVGEMRDPETAETCVQASMTGHLVLSTLHTNDAASALTRLLDLGVPDYLVASTVETVLAQRLVRTTCSRCAEAEPVDPSHRRKMEADGWEVEEVRRGRGCESCRGTGYRGRTGIYELLDVSERVRSEVLSHGSSGGIRRLAREQGMRPLRSDGWRQVAEGRTTPEEVLRVSAS